VGLSEGEAQRQDIEARVAKLPTSAVLRTQTIDERQGFMKALVAARDDHILRATDCSISSFAHREQLEAAIEFAREGDIVA
jgi:pyruvate/2-oxoglutarate dehydrogenase complex dihydrolipoamide dehydrogenase (E3) component